MLLDYGPLTNYGAFYTNLDYKFVAQLNVMATFEAQSHKYALKVGLARLHRSFVVTASMHLLTYLPIIVT